MADANLAVIAAQAANNSHARLACLKRSFDLFLAGTGLLLSLPLLLLIYGWVCFCLHVFVQDSESVLFRQSRLGLNGKPFVMYKFRTLYLAARTGSEGILAPIPHGGSFLRRHHLNELPQLFNILHGEMSIVGPRPILQCVLEKYQQTVPEFGQRMLSIKPGLTGAGQLVNDYSESTMNIRAMDRADLDYVSSPYSPWRDLAILWQTRKALGTGR